MVFFEREWELWLRSWEDKGTWRYWLGARFGVRGDRGMREDVR